ncbi:hypothetical protein [Acetobacterium bakii]|uniref:hypothetical protein n=1 Tax=Acetobacterium bakii TaxID=52689 RepID=UPI0006835261|nr:hypothetical protein [Acetobacterium bakii]
MKTENKKNSLSIALYIGGIIVAIMGVALLITTVKYYSDTYTQAVAAGYDAAQVSAQLLPSQLLPGVFQAIGVYGGIALILICMGTIYQKVSNYMNQSNNEEINVGALEINVAELTEIQENDASDNAELAAVDTDNNEIAGMNEQPTEEKL